MEKEPLVSIIVPLYNYSEYIRDCIKSIQNQDYNCWELFVIDDCSTDNSYEVAKSFERDSRIKILKTKINSGYSKAKNEGIISSKGNLITTLDADDMFTKNSLSIRVKRFKKNNIDFVHGRAARIGGGITLEQAYKIDLKKAKFGRARIHAQGVMYKRDIHIKYGLYDEILRSRADKEMWHRLFGRGTEGTLCDVKTFKIEDVVAYYRRHNGSMMARRKKNKKLQSKLRKQLNASVLMRQKKIDLTNTRFLEK